MKFESLNDGMFESFSDSQTRTLRGGETAKVCNCVRSGGQVICDYDGPDPVVAAL